LLQTLDLECDKEGDRDVWVSAFRWLRGYADRASKPFNVKHVTLVNSILVWSGVNLIDAFELRDLLGEGSFGQVYRAVHRASGLEMAIKMVNAENESTAREIAAEVDILKACRHTNIVSYYGCWSDKDERRLWILMELCDRGSITDLIKASDLLPTEQQIAYVLACTLKALTYLHKSRKIFHRDIKGGNILLAADGAVKVTDFGISKKFEGTAAGQKAPSAAAGGVGGAAHGAFELPAGSPLWYVSCCCVLLCGAICV
jgi:serine/threonine protein kinase